MLTVEVLTPIAAKFAFSVTELVVVAVVADMEAAEPPQEINWLGSRATKGVDVSITISLVDLFLNHFCSVSHSELAPNCIPGASL